MNGQLIHTCEQNIMKTKKIIIYFNIIRLFLWISENISISRSKFTSISRSTANKHKSLSRSSVIEFLTVVLISFIFENVRSHVVENTEDIDDVDDVKTNDDDEEIFDDNNGTLLRPI
jgi:hypothetical protein